MCVCEYCDSYVPIYMAFTRWQKKIPDKLFSST